MATLEFGAKGKEVKSLQSILKRGGYFHGDAKGNFLKLTRAAVVAFQHEHRGPKGATLRDDGVVDDDTWWALRNAGEASTGGTTATSAALEFGDKGEEVKVLQRLLKDQGYFKGAVKGNFLKLTKEAVIYFQQTHLGPDGENLASDGVVGTNTWWALRHPSGSPQRSGLPGEIPKGLTPKRQAVLRVALAEHAAGVKEIPDGANSGDGVDKYILAGTQPAWCCYFWSWVDKQALGSYSLKARLGRVSTAFEKARSRKFARQKGDYMPIPGDAFIMATSDAEKGKYKFTGNGHIGFVLRVEVKNGKAVAINTVEGNSSNRVKLGSRKLSDAAIVGFINNFGKNEQPTGWETGLVKAGDTSRGGTR